MAEILRSQCRGPGLHPWSGETRSHLSQLRVLMWQLEIPCVATKTWSSQREEGRKEGRKEERKVNTDDHQTTESSRASPAVHLL